MIIRKDANEYDFKRNKICLNAINNRLLMSKFCASSISDLKIWKNQIIIFEMITC